MELISASRVAKAQERAAAARPYAEQITSVILDLTRRGGGRPPAAAGARTVRAGRPRSSSRPTEASPVRTTAAASCAAGRRAPGPPGRGDYYALSSGTKAQRYFRFRGFRQDNAFSGMTDKPTYEDARPGCRGHSSGFEAGEFDAVDLVYTRFRSLSTQEVVVRRFLPLEIEEADDEESGLHADFEFEPSPRESSMPSSPLRRGPPVLGSPRRFSLGARRPPAGHEGGDRQRRGPHHHPQPQHEPSPPGRHHH